MRNGWLKSFTTLPLLCAVVVARTLAADAKFSEPETPCYHSNGDRYHCEFFKSPLDHAQTTQTNIDVFYAKFEYQLKGREQSPIFLIAGGPGQSAVQTFVPARRLFKNMFGNRNVWLVDQRGLGRSTPIECKALDKLDPFEHLNEEEKLVGLIKACANNAVHPLNFFTTDDYIDDMERLRRAKNMGKVMLYGGSYGTRVALRYAYRYPEAVDKIILEGFAGLHLVVNNNVQRDIIDTLTLLQKRCNEDEICGDTFPNIVENYHKILERLPATITFRHPKTLNEISTTLQPHDFIKQINAFLYRVSSQNLVPLTLQNMVDNNDYTPFMGMALASQKQELSAMLHFAVTCQEDVPFASAPSNAIQKAILGPTQKICESFPPRALDPEFRVYRESDIPMLFLSGATDPVTPPRHVQQVKKHFPNAQFLELNQYAHTFSFALPCAQRAVKQFVSGKVIEGCPADLPTTSLFITNMGH